MTKNYMNMLNAMNMMIMMINRKKNQILKRSHLNATMTITMMKTMRKNQKKLINF